MSMVRAFKKEATHHSSVMQGMTEGEVMSYVQGLVDAATVVYGIYPDVETPEGFGLYVIKGGPVPIDDIAAMHQRRTELSRSYPLRGLSAGRRGRGSLGW